MKQATQPSANVAGKRLRTLAVAFLYALPLAASLALLLLVTNAYMACSGSEVLATTKRLSQFFWLFALPVLMYTAVALSFVRWRSTTLVAHLTRTFAAIGVIGFVYLYWNARYFTLTQADCVGGLPYWWPDWLPAR